MDPHRRAHRHRPLAARAAALGLVVLAAACSPGPEAVQGEGPEAPVREEFGGRPSHLTTVFEGLPKVPGSHALHPRQESSRAVTRTFEVTGKSPRAVMTYYQNHLDADLWAPISPPGDSGRSTRRGRWSGRGVNLVISATPWEGNPEDRVSQYSITVQDPRP